MFQSLFIQIDYAQSPGPSKNGDHGTPLLEIQKSSDARPYDLEANFTLTTKAQYNRCTGISKFENIYPRYIRRRSNLGHIF